MMFSPVLQRMNDLANSEQFTKASNGIIQSLAVASSVALEFVNLMIAGSGWIVDHWDIIGPCLLYTSGSYLPSCKDVVCNRSVRCDGRF